MKQTAVEWLEDRILQVPDKVWEDLFEQAKEMEKQQQGYSELVDLLERLTPIYREDSDLHQKYDRQRLEFIEQFKKL